MLKRYMHGRERHHAFLEDNRVVHPFDWGTEFIGVEPGSGDPREIFSEFSRRTLEHSEDFFISPKIADYRLEGDRLTWTSAVATPSVENNTVYAKYFPHATNRRSAVLVLPHWNAKARTYWDLCKIFNKVGLSALRMTLPFHEERMPPELVRADYLVAPNVGRTLQGLQQSVVDARGAVRWLKQQGFEKIGIVGTSIGSCVGFFAFTHDMDIDTAVFNHVSGYPADVVWHGLSTYAVKEGIGDNLTLDELREYWLPISPMAYIERLSKLPPRPQRYIYTLYDLSFPVGLSRDTINALRRHKIKHSTSVIPCGHYTLGQKPWVYYDGYKIVSFLRKHLK